MEKLDVFYRHRGISQSSSTHRKSRDLGASPPPPPPKEHSEPLVAKVMNSNSLSPVHKGLHAELTASVGRCQESHLAFPTAIHLSHCQGTGAARLPCGPSSLCICMKGRDTPAPPRPAPSLGETGMITATCNICSILKSFQSK